ncbi:hypothetical protein BYT27DRAFT_7225411 [Phlegmacium glaucopus]|nr:hypothetical protein BYT27DRAFT_7225411 [Phlegmacium glaucopus]
MEQNAYPQPPPFTWNKYHVRDALPVYPPPEPLDLPALPSPPRKPAFDVPFTLTTHLFPASYLRTTPLIPLPKLPHAGATKEERRQVLAESASQLLDWGNDTKVTDGYPLILWNCVNRYVKKGLDLSNRTGVTLFLAHANGFPKEIWEPVVGRLLSLPAAGVIDEIWAWESVHHGDAGLINAAKASGVSDWIDGGRDVANFLLHFLPPTPTGTVLPVHLQRVSAEETSLRIQRGFKDRKLVAVGHSYGGCICSLAASVYPNLFHSLVLVDPVILQPPNPDDVKPSLFLPGALSRRDTWSSRQEALDSFSKNPFFQAWHPAVLRIYVDCGIYLTKDEHGKEIAKLKMPGVLEAVVFADIHTAFEVYERLVNLDERIVMRWLMPGKPGAPELGKPGTTKYRVWVRPKKSTNVKIMGGGHLIPQEAPHEMADDLNKFILHHFQMAVPSLKASL